MRALPAGYKLRVLIAKVLFGRPDVMLLDEPTNHLDLESIHWLIQFLVDEFTGTLLVVSHDRHFLNAVATHIADIDYRTITIYTGNYADFVGAKYENQQRAEAAAQGAKKKIGELQDFVQRFGSHASQEQAGAESPQADREARGRRRDQGRQALEPGAAVRPLRVRQAERPRRARGSRRRARRSARRSCSTA